ncbi:MAG: SRPBCC family protein [Salibacteraceae bacterium]
MHQTHVSTHGGITVISSEIEIKARKNKVWEVLRDIGGIAQFHPLVKASKTLSHTASGLGARRYCALLPMGSMEEEVIAWHEGQSFVMEVVGGQLLPPHKFMKGHIELSDNYDSTKVRFSFSYQLKYGVLGRWMNALLIQPQFKKAPPQYVQGLKAYVENTAH